MIKKVMSMKKYRNVYLESVHRFINGTSDKPDHKIFEYLYALELDLINWDDLPPDFDEKFDIPHKMDYGVDLVDLDYTKACQVKKYEKSKITWSHLCKFKTYAFDILDTEHGNIILAITKTAKIDELGEKKLINTGKIILLRNDFSDLLDKYKNILPERSIINEKVLEKRDYLLECHSIILESPQNKVKCQLPCGCGKTYIILYTIQQELLVDNSLKFIVFVPWLDLAKQTFNLFEDFGLKCKFIGNGKTDMSGEYNVIICINPSVVHIDSEVEFKYKFIDEAHHLENEDSKILEKINKIKAEKEIHFSATFHNTDDLDYEYPLRKAIDEGWISDYVLHFLFFDEGDRMDAMVKMLKGKTEYFPMFVYFNSTERSKLFYEKLKENGINADYLDGNSTLSKRRVVKNRLKSGLLDVVSLCGVYNEGISIDNIRTVMFGDLRYSDINKIQIMMRACRLHDSKPFFRVIIPTGDLNFSCKDVGDIVRTFCKIDPKMKEDVVRKSKSRMRVEGIDISKDVDNADILYTQVYDRMGKFLEGKSNEEVWMDNLERVKAYIDKYNKRPPKKDSDKNIKYLGCWLCTQKKNYPIKTQIMMFDRIRKKWEEFINDEKYNDYFKSHHERWLKRLYDTQNFIDKYHRRPSSNDKNYYKLLAKWVDAQITQYPKKVYLMKSEIIRNKWKDFIENDKYKMYFMSPENIWIDKLNKLRKYIDEHKDLPEKYNEDYKLNYLWSWIRTQRKNYSKRSAMLSRSNIIKLWMEFINDNKYKIYFLTSKERWIENLNKVKEYIDINNKRPATSDKNKNIQSLGTWISTQIQNYNKKLHIMLDNDIKTLWENFITNIKYKKYFISKENIWKNKLESLKEYMDNNYKRPSLRSKDENVKSLGKWILTQTMNYKKNIGSIKNNEIRQLWENFVNHEKYKKYFFTPLLI